MEITCLSYTFLIKKKVNKIMKYIKLFEEKLNEGEIQTLNIKKYYDVEFVRGVTINNVYNGEGSPNIDVKINKGEQARLYIDQNKVDNTKFYVTAIRPLLERTTNENTEIEMNKLWNGGFLLNKEFYFDTKNLPFKIIQ